MTRRLAPREVTAPQGQQEPKAAPKCRIRAGILRQPWGTATNPPPAVPRQLRVGTEPLWDRTRRGTHRGGGRTEGQHVTRTHRTRGSSGSCCHDPPGTAGGSSWETPKSTHAEGAEPGWAPGRAVPTPGLGHRPPVELLGPGWGAAGPQRDRKGAYGTLDGSWSEGWSGGHGSMRDGLGRARRRGWSGVNVWGGELGNIWGGQQKHRTPINAGRGQRGDRARRGGPSAGPSVTPRVPLLCSCHQPLGHHDHLPPCPVLPDPGDS